MDILKRSLSTSKLFLEKTNILKILFRQFVDLFSFSDMAVSAVKRDFHKNHQCWTVDPDQVQMLLMSV